MKKVYELWLYDTPLMELTHLYKPFRRDYRCR